MTYQSFIAAKLGTIASAGIDAPLRMTGDLFAEVA